MSRSLKFGLIGHHIGYSKSADIFKAIFELKKLDGTFELFDLLPESFEKQFSSLISQGFDGLSVTIPYKKRVMPLLNEITPVAKQIEAVNSIKVGGAKLLGDNTDVFGFAKPLKQYSAKLKQGRALVLGCGGSARAVVYSLHYDYGISDFTVLGRSAKKLAEFEKSFANNLKKIKLRTDILVNYSKLDGNGFAIVVNCTPLGGWNKPNESPLPPGFSWSTPGIYYDLNYNEGNQILKKASDNGLKAIDGSVMLVGQAVKSFEFWTGETIECESVYKKVFGRCPKASMVKH